MSKTTQPQNKEISDATQKKVYKTSEAQRRANKKYREKNKEKLEQYHKDYRAKNRELLNKKSLECYYKRGYKKEYYSKEKRQAYYKAYYEKNKAKCIEATKNWQKKNPEKVKELNKKSLKTWREKQEHFYKFTKDTGLSFKVEILKMNKVEAEKYAELNKMDYVKCRNYRANKRA